MEISLDRRSVEGSFFMGHKKIGLGLTVFVGKCRDEFGHWFTNVEGVTIDVVRHASLP